LRRHPTTLSTGAVFIRVRAENRTTGR